MTATKNEILRVLKNDVEWHSVTRGTTHHPFSPILIQFANELSRRLIADNTSRRFPELVALAFWLRQTNLSRLAETFKMRLGDQVMNPRGTVFHIAPSNVDTIFVYSWIMSLLCGNRNIVRISSNRSPQIECLLGAIDVCLGLSEFSGVSQSVSLIRYEHSDELTSTLSQLADTRVIWGGDNTVEAIRRIPLPATANEVAFANKLSIAIVDEEYWTEASDVTRNDLAREFASDAYQYGQAACSSPRVLVWKSQQSNYAERDDFWNRVTAFIDSYAIPFREIDFVNKLLACNIAATKFPARVISTDDNRLTRVWIDSEYIHDVLASDVHCGGGMFFETAVLSLQALLPAMSRRVQTLTYAGISAESLRESFQSHLCNGVDRVVPIGRALDFSHIWDGFDFFDIFLRRITIS